eukprot:9805660-Lingulodinium_polyedra.AAC.1
MLVPANMAVSGTAGSSGGPAAGTSPPAEGLEATAAEVQQEEEARREAAYLERATRAQVGWPAQNPEHAPLKEGEQDLA